MCIIVSSARGQQPLVDGHWTETVSVPHLAQPLSPSSMERPQIESIVSPAEEAHYKLHSAAATAYTLALVRLSQMRRDETQRPIGDKHVNDIRRSMQRQGVRKGEHLYGYIDVHDEAWGNRSESDAVALFEDIKSHNKNKGGGLVSVGILPKNIPVRISDGSHRLYAFSRHLVETWDDIQDPKPPLEFTKADRKVDRPFPENLGKSLEEIFAQDTAWWFVRLAYIRK